MSAETWLVVCEGGAVREVAVRHTPGSYGGEWRAEADGADSAGGSSARWAVMILVAEAHWPVVELVDPGAQRLAQAIAERDYWREQATMMAPCVDEIRRLTRRVVRGGTGCALDPVRAVDAAIAQADALADADLILEERERQLTAALTAVAAERARCAAVCRSVACFYDGGDVGSVVAHACADEIERECVSALLRTPGA